VAGMPVRLVMGEVLRRVGQGFALVFATLLLAVRIGVVGAQRPGGGEGPAGGKFQALGDGFIDVDLLRIAAVGNSRAPGDLDRVAAGDLVLELVVEQRGVGVETSQVVEVHAEFGAGGGFRLEVGVADGDDLTLSGRTVYAGVEVVQVRCAVAAAHTALHGPAVGRVPDEVSAWADMPAKGFVIV